MSKWRRIAKAPTAKQASPETRRTALFVVLVGTLAASIVGPGTAYASPNGAQDGQSVSTNHSQTSTVKKPATTKTTLLHVQMTMNQVPTNLTPGAKAASDRYEALQHGYMVSGTDPVQMIMYGQVPPGMAPHQARMLYNALPHLPKSPGPMTPEMAERFAGGPTFAAAGLPEGLNPEDVRAANEQMIRGHLRERFGPIYIPSLHRDRNRSAQSTSKAAESVTIPVKHFYTKDHLGSIREVTDSSGNIVSQYSYDPYGRQVKIAGTGPDADFGYQNYYLHQRSGLNLTLHRAYNPSIGRWLSRDPIAENGGVNLYAYVENNPISRSDPTGLWQYSGNWGGPGWTSGRNQSELSNFPPNSNYQGWQQPTNPVDRCYYWHDVCLHNAAREKNDNQRKCIRNFCDKDLSSCLKNVVSTYGNQYGSLNGEIGMFGQTNSPNNNTGEYVPNLTQYDQNYDPGFQN